jgi:hypothetical protein
MPKYILKSLNVVIGNKLIKKDCKNPQIFDTEGNYKAFAAEVESAAKAGFLEPVEDKKKTVAKK